MDQPLQAEPKSVVDDIPLFSLTPEDSEPLIEVEPKLPPIQVVPEILLQRNTLNILEIHLIITETLDMFDMVFI